MHWAIFTILAGVLAAVLANELAFSGRLFPSSEVGISAGLLTVALAVGVRILGDYRGLHRVVGRDTLIWAVIVAAIAAVYWFIK